MEIKDNMEHLSLSQSKSNMKQFNKQLQAIPREMIEWLGLRGHAGRLQTVRRGFFTRACCRVLGNCGRVKNDMPAKSEQWPNIPEEKNTVTDGNVIKQSTGDVTSSEIVKHLTV